MKLQCVAVINLTQFAVFFTNYYLESPVKHFRDLKDLSGQLKNRARAEPSSTLATYTKGLRLHEVKKAEISLAIFSEYYLCLNNILFYEFDHSVTGYQD